MTIDELIAKVRDHLGGIDRIQDDPRGGYWQTTDGARAGKIILLGLEQMCRDNWPGTVAPLPADGEVAKVAKELESHAHHIKELDAEGWPTDNDLPSLLTRAAELLQQRHPEPVAVSERPWDRPGWCNYRGQCWMGDPGGRGFIPSWRLCRPKDAPNMTASLPHDALPLLTTGDNT